MDQMQISRCGCLHPVREKRLGRLILTGKQVLLLLNIQNPYVKSFMVSFQMVHLTE